MIHPQPLAEPRAETFVGKHKLLINHEHVRRVLRIRRSVGLGEDIRRAA
jgi:hypothetical protein